MMKKAVLALALALMGVAWAELAPPERSYNILMLLPVSSKSHRNVFLPVAEALADRGHKIVMLVNHPPALKHPNVQEINHELPDFREENMNMFATRENPAAAFGVFETALPAIARKLYKVPKVKELYDRRKEFDLIVINHMFNEVAYPFAHEMPYITIATPGMDYRQSAVLGNVLNPAYVPNIMKSYPLPMSMLHRFINTIEHIMLAVHWRHWSIVPPVQKEISAQFPDLPSLLDIERNQSLTLMNSHFTMNDVLPLLPSQVEVGAMHCRPGKPLPEDLESWISGAGSEGVVYFSLGSVAQGQSMPKKYRDMFVEAFKKLKQRVIWKYEVALEGVSDNVIMRKWLPQQDILAHPNVRVFITHGGLLSTQESFYHSTPVLAVPIFGDQPKNGMNIQNNGLGLMLVWEELTVELIVNSLQEIISNPKYKARAAEVQGPLRDQPDSPKDRAVFWTEYVIRHKGAPRLRSPAAQLSWVEFLMLDVLLVFHVAVFVAVYVVRRLLGAVCSWVFGSKSKGKKKRDDRSGCLVNVGKRPILMPANHRCSDQRLEGVAGTSKGRSPTFAGQPLWSLPHHSSVCNMTITHVDKLHRKESAHQHFSIMSDCWKDYDCLEDEGFKHHRVEHRLNFDDLGIAIGPVCSKNFKPHNVEVTLACAELAPPERSYKILMLLPVSSKSHRNVFMPIAEALADRGHKIVMLVNHPPASKHPNIQEINHELTDFREENMNMFETRENPAGAFGMFETALPAIARKLYKVPKVKELYDRRKEFDLIVINHMFNELAYPFAHEMPFITVATPGVDYRQSAVLGNVLNPAYVPHSMKAYPLPMTMLRRFLNTVAPIMIAVYWRHWSILPPVQQEISAQFPDLPLLLDIERNQSLTLMNSHFAMNDVLPLLPSQVEVGAMHCRPGKPLPEDLESWISGAGLEGVVYFSLGSVTQGQSMPKKYRDMFVEAFKQLKQRVIWKYEVALEGVSDNVLMRKWLPQQDILAHPNVRVFITHGGLLSTQESFYHSTPVLAVPIFGDQPKNGMNIQDNGLGLMLVWEELTVELIVNSLQEIISNPKYKARAAEVQGPLRDQPQSPKDRAVFWTEYVIRHKGAPRLRSPAAQLSWVEFLMLDVLLVFHVAVFVAVYVVRRLLGAVCSWVFGSRSTGKKKAE
ncbi:uncharacterized protein LOC119588212 [Penaeus monodon]|uniref:uncharacterized protein LOC119588212 n=1 Tax=Penaeus monodon TaxID=6687 RepID=UPI0018A78275|nr:uncharacterized protein LOC119588212 [Penaeus monodon]